MKKSCVSLVLAMMMVLTLLAGCGGGNGGSSAPAPAPAQSSTPASDGGSAAPAEPAAPAASGKVMLYSSMQEDQLVAIKEGFEKKYPGVQMEYYFAGTSKVVTKISTEAQAGHVDADVIWVGDAADYVSFKENNILQPYTSPELDGGAIDKNYVDPDGYYTAGRLVGVGIAYNNASVKPEDAPKTWSDLLDPKWKDQIVMSDPGTAGTTKYWMNAMMCSDKYGKDYMQKLHDNGCRLESGTTATHNQLAAGAYQVGVCLDYVSANLIKEGSPMTFLYPEETVSIASPIGLVKDCNNEENGKLLYDFILSKEGQEILVANNLVSVRSDVTQSVDLSTIPSFLECDMAKLAADSDTNLTDFNGIWGL